MARVGRHLGALPLHRQQLFELSFVGNIQWICAALLDKGLTLLSPTLHLQTQQPLVFLRPVARIDGFLPAPVQIILSETNPESAG